MAKILRTTQKQFGGTAGGNQIAKFGSLAAGSPVRYSGSTATAANVQALNNFLNGWFDAVIGSNSPTIEDMNALFWLAFYQICYIMQAGVPEWDAATTYYIGSIVSDGIGNLYSSTTDANVNNVVTDGTHWQSVGGVISTNIVTTGPQMIILLPNNKGQTFLVDSTLGALSFLLPAPATNPNFWFRVKDVGGQFDVNPCTFFRSGTELFEGLAASYVARAPYGEWMIATHNVNWHIIGR